MAENIRSAGQVVGALALAAICAACDGQTSPPAPTQTVPVPAPTEFAALRGNVIAFTASGEQRPVPNLRLKVRRAAPSDGAVGGLELPDVVSDANGHYEIPGDTGPIVFVSTAPGSDHRFLCDWYPLIVRDALLLRLRDLPVVHQSWTGNRLPPGMWSPSTSVHGVVSERLDGTLRPVTGATVTLDTGTQDPPATTTASGFYMVCSIVGTDQTRTITARKDGYSPTSREIFGGWDFRVDLELGRD